LLNDLACDRETVIFDTAGTGRSEGSTPDKVQDMARTATSILGALSFPRIDMLGFSLGGFVAQQIILDNPKLVRRLVLSGTGPRGGEGFSPFSDLVEHLASLPKGANGEDRLALFFANSEASRSAGVAYLERLERRQTAREPHTTLEVMKAHHAAIYNWEAEGHGNFDYLKTLTLPVLVTNGQWDIMIPTANSYILQKHPPDSQLIIYPDSAHAALFQYPALFAKHVRTFFDSASEWPSS
jgi:pimeloyl-ACP methyl ester carboxylesterase